MIPLMTVCEVARVLGFTPQYIRRLASDGKLPSIKAGHRAIRFYPSDVEGFIKQRRRENGDTEAGK